MIYTDIFTNNPLRMPFNLFKDTDSVNDVVWDPAKSTQCHILELAVIVINGVYRR